MTKDEEKKAMNITLDGVLLHLERMVCPPNMAELKKNRNVKQIYDVYHRSLKLPLLKEWECGGDEYSNWLKE